VATVTLRVSVEVSLEAVVVVLVLLVARETLLLVVQAA
jgi:hypothetical protein